MEHVRHAVVDLQTEVKNSWSTISRAMDALVSASEDLGQVQTLNNTYEDLMRVDRAGAQVRSSVSQACDQIYDAVREIEAIFR